MWESTKLSMDVEVVNLDHGSDGLNYGHTFSQWVLSQSSDSLPIHLRISESRAAALDQVRNK